ncbi:MAG: fatty acyl-AMP ligase [Proteobacteria bacterium]|nr:fatty acyl-AMP ligase [Pseudomonadota bacterium]
MTQPAAQTLVSALEQLPNDSERGFRFLDPQGQERNYPQRAIRAEAKRRAALLLQHGLRKGDRVVVAVAQEDEFVLSFLGAVVAGLVPVPVSATPLLRAVDGHLGTLRHVSRASGARAVVVMERNRSLLGELWDGQDFAPRLLSVEADLAGAPQADVALPRVTPQDPCFVQFTSGSTALPKGVTITHANLVRNARDFLGPSGLDRRDDDLGVSWLPLFHDMGLIGFILGTLICDIPVVILPTAAFARNPRSWLETIHSVRGTITYAPNFAYGLAAKRLRERDLARLDLSCLRVAGCGAEPINPDTMRAFARRLQPTGFRAEALLPSYGMAEATLAITFHPHGTPLATDRVDSVALRAGRATQSERVAQSTELVSCGRPFPGHELRTVDEQGRKLGDRQVGEIVVRGPSVSPGYHNDPAASAASFRNGWLHTGDLGYLAGGNLYICGRVKDLIIVRGANYYPQDIEWLVSSLEGVRRDNAIAFGVVQDGEERLVVAAECASADAQRLREAIAARVSEATGLAVARVSAVRIGALPKTTSGKVQRRKTKQLFEEGKLEEHGP